MNTTKKNKLLETWIELQVKDDNLRDDLISNKDVKEQSRQLLSRLLPVLKDDDLKDFNNDKFDGIKEILSEISYSRAHNGFSPKETGMFILCLKKAFFIILKDEYKDDVEGFFQHMLKVDKLLDQMSLFTFDSFLKGREEVILRQREEISEISTPVLKVWKEILAVPIIGTLDSSRTQTIMENLLTEIVKTGSSIAILDISGVPAVDSLVAQHLIKTVSATRLLGAECIISGIRPEIAQTMVHLGINLSDIITKTSLANALQHALRLQKFKIIKSNL